MGELFKVNKYEVIIMFLLFLAGVWLWSLPIQNSPLPYGEVDSHHHLMISDWMSTYDKVSDQYPYPLFYRYGDDNAARYGYTVYAPNFFMNAAIMQVISGERFVSYFLWVSILSVSILLSMYYFMRVFFGFWPAFLTSLMILFSRIEIFSHIFGQYVILPSFAALPLVMLCYYKYTQSYLEGKSRPVYLYILALLVVTQFINHSQSAGHSFLIVLFYSVYLVIKHRKIPFSIKHAVIAFVVLFGVLGPLAIKPIQYTMFEPGTGFTSSGIGQYFQWYDDAYDKVAAPQIMFSYTEMHGLWTLPLLLVGLFILIYRREDKDLMLLFWFIALYIIFHLDVMMEVCAGRLFRSINDVSHMFYAIITVGLMGIMGLVPKNAKQYAKYGLIIMFIFLAFYFNGANAYALLNNAYGPTMRVNQAEHDAAMWIRQNIPLDADIRHIGTPQNNVQTFIKAIAQRQIFEDQLGVDSSIKYWLEDEERSKVIKELWNKESIVISHYMIDYSVAEEFAKYGRQDIAQQIAYGVKQLEDSIMNSSVLLYNKDNIRIYKANTENAVEVKDEN